ncbi:MAG: UPF0280 family protein [archaeon]|nr:UPF0280 family protein [archaeon]
MNIDIGETHIRLTTDLENINLKNYILKLRRDLEGYILLNPEFKISLDKLDKPKEIIPAIVNLMYDASIKCDIGPMATVAGAIAGMSLDYLISLGSTNSIVENGGDIAIINSEKILCGIYSNNEILGNNIAFKLKKRKNPLGISTSSGKIGHSISFGTADSVTVLGGSPAITDGLATKIANEVSGSVENGLNLAENYKEYFDGILIISGEEIGTMGHLPKIIEVENFNYKV